MNSLFLINFLLWILISSCANLDDLYEVSIIHKDIKKKIILKSWLSLIEESINLIKKRNNLESTILSENDLNIWNNGEIINEKYLESNHFKNGTKNIYVFLSNNIKIIPDDNCITKDNIYKKIGGEIEKYKNLFKKYFQFNDKRGEEWNAMKEILKLLMKTKELREIVKDIKTDEQIESARQKIIEITKENDNYKVYFDALSENKVIYNILNDSEEWLNFVKSNFENMKNLIKSYTTNPNDDL